MKALLLLQYGKISYKDSKLKVLISELNDRERNLFLLCMCYTYFQECKIIPLWIADF